MINPFNNEHYGISTDGNDLFLITAEATTKLSKQEARLFGRALIAMVDFDEIEVRSIIEEAERVEIVGSYYSSDGTLMNADGTRSIFDDVDK